MVLVFRCVVQCVLAGGLAVHIFAYATPTYAQFFQERIDPEAIEALRQQRLNDFLLRGPTRTSELEEDDESEQGESTDLLNSRSPGNRRSRNSQNDNTFDNGGFLLRAGVDTGADEEETDDQERDGDDPDRSPEDERLEARERSVVQSRVQEPVSRLETQRVDRLEAPDLRGDQNEIDAIRTGTVLDGDDEDQEVEGDETEEVGPYDPLGGKIGQLTFFPSFEIRGGYTDNAGGSSFDPSGASFQTFRATNSVESDWSRHELNASVAGEYQFFNDTDQDGDFSLDADASLLLNVTNRTDLELAGSVTVDQTSVGDDGAPEGTSDRPYVFGSDVFAQLSHRFNRLTAAILVGSEQETNQDGEVGGVTIDNSDLDFREDRLQTSLTYELSPITDIGLTGTIQQTEFEGDTADSSNSTGYSIAATLSFRPSDVWALEGSVGFENDDFDDPLIGNVEDIIYNATLTWRPTIFTTVAFSGERSVDVTTESGSSAVVANDYSLSLTHEFRENISLTLTGLVGIDEFIGAAREDERLEASAEFLYELNRFVAFVADFDYAQRESTLPGLDREELEGSAGFRLRY